MVQLNRNSKSSTISRSQDLDILRQKKSTIQNLLYVSHASSFQEVCVLQPANMVPYSLFSVPIGICYYVSCNYCSTNSILLTCFHFSYTLLSLMILFSQYYVLFVLSRFNFQESINKHFYIEALFHWLMVAASALCLCDRCRQPRHYLSSGALSLSAEDIGLLAQCSTFSDRRESETIIEQAISQEYIS